MKFRDYLAAERGRSVSVGAAAGVSATFLSQIANGQRGCPAERAAAIEKACHFEVRRWDLRPDDWHRIWPELVGADGAPDIAQVPPASASEAA